MKKLLLIILFAIGASMQLSAQAKVNPQFGINITALDYGVALDGSFEAEANAGYQLGFVIRTGGTFFFEPGIFLMGTNQRYVVKDDNNLQITGQAGSHSLQLPLRFGITTGGGEGQFNLRLAAGPVIGYTVGSKENPFDLSEADFSDLNYAAKGGIGFDIFFITLDFDYQVGLNDVFKEGSSFRLATLAEGGRNNALMVTAGVKF
jgi:hypothetical protein